jgi:hypothetical protein
MGGPAWLSYVFTAIMLAVAGYCATRLVAARWWHRRTDLDADGAHVVMGVTIAGVLVADLRFLSAEVWEGIFAVGAVWFGWQAVRARRGAPQSQWRCPQPVPHLVECGAMLYIFAAITGIGPATSVIETRFSLLALALALFMFGWAVWVVDRLRVGTPALAAGWAGGGRPGGYLAPRCAAVCTVAIGVTMGYVLILML